MRQQLIGFSVWAWVGLAVAVAGLAPPARAQPAGAGWTGEFTLRYESSGNRPLEQGERGGASGDTFVSGKREWKIAQEVRGTISYTQKVRGAVARRMPDANNEQRYESWLFRPGGAGVPAAMSITSEEVVERALRLGKADGEGAGEINRARAGKFGRVEHSRERWTIVGEGDKAALLHGGGFMQIDRDTNKLWFEIPSIKAVSPPIQATYSKVARVDNPAGPGVWDESKSAEVSGSRLMFIGGLPEPLVFDIPAGANEFSVTRSFDREGQLGGKVMLTLAMRRGAVPSAASAPPPAAVAPAASAPAPVSQGAPRKPDAAVNTEDAAAAVNRLRGLLAR